MAETMRVNEATGELRPMRLLDLADTEAELVSLIEELAQAEQEDERDEEAITARRAALEEALAAVRGGEADKVDAIGEVIDELKAQEAVAETFRRSADEIRARWMRRRDSLKRGQVRLREYVGVCLDTAGVTKIAGRKHQARWQGQAASLTVVEGAAAQLARAGYGEAVITVRLAADDVAHVAELLGMEDPTSTSPRPTSRTWSRSRPRARTACRPSSTGW